jgi:hypothetical protein
MTDLPTLPIRRCRKLAVSTAQDNFFSGLNVSVRSASRKAAEILGKTQRSRELHTVTCVTLDSGDAA